MLLIPDPESARMDPFAEQNILNITCDVIEPSTGLGYERDPRSVAKAESYLKSTGIGDTVYFGPEPEFFVFDSVNWKIRWKKLLSKLIQKKVHGVQTLIMMAEI